MESLLCCFVQDCGSSNRWLTAPVIVHRSAAHKAPADLYGMKRFVWRLGPSSLCAVERMNDVQGAIGVVQRRSYAHKTLLLVFTTEPVKEWTALNKDMNSLWIIHRPCAALQDLAGFGCGNWIQVMSLICSSCNSFTGLRIYIGQNAV